jgi:hypothetical protein
VGIVEFPADLHRSTSFGGESLHVTTPRGIGDRWHHHDPLVANLPTDPTRLPMSKKGSLFMVWSETAQNGLCSLCSEWVMVMDDQLEKWVEHLSKSCGPVEVLPENLVAIDASACPRPDVAGAPPEARLLIRNAGVEHRSLTLVAQSPPSDWQPSGEDPRMALPQDVEVEGAPTLKKVSLEATPRRVTLRLETCHEAVALVGGSLRRLSIVGGKVKLERAAPHSLLLSDTVLQFKDRLSPRYLRLQGEVSIRGGNFEAMYGTRVAEGTALVDTFAKHLVPWARAAH